MWHRLAQQVVRWSPVVILDLLTVPFSQFLRKYQLTYAYPPDGVPLPQGGRMYPSGPRVPVGTTYRFTDRRGAPRAYVVALGGDIRRVDRAYGDRILQAQHRRHLKRRVVFALVLLSPFAVAALLWWAWLG